MYNITKTIVFILFAGSIMMFFSFRPKSTKKDLLQILETAFKQKVSISRKSKYHYYDTHLINIRKKAFWKFNIPLDTTQITSCIVINQVNFGAQSNIFGKIIINDSIEYNYYENQLTKELVSINESGIFSDSLVVSLLKLHQFDKLKVIAEEEGEKLSEAYVYYILCYDKNWDCTYVQMLPAFIKDDPNYQ